MWQSRQSFLQGLRTTGKVLSTCAKWGNTYGVAEPLLQAKLLLYTVVYCEVDRRWQWIGWIVCNGYAVTNLTAGNTST